MTDDMLNLAKKARDLAYAPYSQFHVGCCIKTGDNQFYTGCNVENASYGLTLCAEGSAIAQMISAGKKEILELAVISNGDDICSPCGACRQRIREFAKPDTPIHMYNAKGDCTRTTLQELLPHSFGPEHLEAFQHDQK